MTSMFPAPTTSPQRLESGTGPGETTLGRFVAENPLWQFMGPIILNISDLFTWALIDPANGYLVKSLLLGIKPQSNSTVFEQMSCSAFPVNSSHIRASEASASHSSWPLWTS